MKATWWVAYRDVNIWGIGRTKRMALRDASRNADSSSEDFVAARCTDRLANLIIVENLMNEDWFIRQQDGVADVDYVSSTPLPANSKLVKILHLQRSGGVAGRDVVLDVLQGRR